jgi:hypothetical protein
MRAIPWAVVLLFACGPKVNTGSETGDSGTSSEDTTILPSGDTPPASTSGSTGSSGSTGGETGQEPTSGSTSTGETPGDPAIEMRCHDTAGFGNKATHGVCVCEVAKGLYPDQESCLAANTPSEEFIDCLCSIYAKYPGLNARLDCIVLVQEDYGSCVESSGCDAELLDVCGGAFYRSVWECPSLPQELIDEGTLMCQDEMP